MIKMLCDDPPTTVLALTQDNIARLLHSDPIMIGADRSLRLCAPVLIVGGAHEDAIAADLHTHRILAPGTGLRRAPGRTRAQDPPPVLIGTATARQGAGRALVLGLTALVLFDLRQGGAVLITPDATPDALIEVPLMIAAGRDQDEIARRFAAGFHPGTSFTLDPGRTPDAPATLMNTGYTPGAPDTAHPGAAR